MRTNSPSRGRPRNPLPKTSYPLTRRVRHLIDRAHLGNVAEASRLTGISYPTVSDLYVGSSVAPNLMTLETMGTPYGLELGWFTEQGKPGAIPRTGSIGLVPPGGAEQKDRRSLRQVLIPFAAWPMYQVFSRLEQRLGALAPAPDRPIVGEARGDAFTFRLTTYLFQPLLGAEKLGEQELVIAESGSAAAAGEGHMPDREWITRLRILGEMWLSVLPKLLLHESSS